MTHSSVSSVVLAVVALLSATSGALIANQRTTNYVPQPPDAGPGGAATSKASVDNTNAFSASSGNIPFERELDFKIGNAVFRKFWVSAPSSTKTSDGLGPLFNARSCQGCHLKDGRGHPPDPAYPDDDAVSLLMRLSVPPSTDAEKALLASHKTNVIPDPTYGGQLQPFSIQGLDAEGHAHITYADEKVTLGDGTVVTLRKPSYEIRNLAYGPLAPNVMMSPRVAPPMIGLGLLELVPEKDVTALADENDANGDGISGRPSRVWSLRDNAVALGRFGWKAGAPTIEQQSADAFANDIGIGSTLIKHAAGDCTPAEKACLAAPDGAPKTAPGVEIADDLFRLVVSYSSNLAVPPRRNAADPQVLEGERMFHEAGCASCHHPSFKTGTSDREPHLSNQTIWPYTDLLLHDLGEGLSDNRPDGVASGSEWRTPPLWGIGLTKTVNGHTYFLHDGRARNIEEAILWHGGEAQSARDAYSKLSKKDRDALVAFVNSL